MKVSARVLLFITYIAGINAKGVGKGSPKCMAAIEKYNKSETGKTASVCFGHMMENSDVFCAKPKCRNAFNLPNEVRKACSTNANDQSLMERADQRVAELKSHINKTCKNKQVQADKQETKPSKKTESKPSSGNGSGSSNNSSKTTSNTGANAATGNKATGNKTTGNKAASNNATGNKATGNKAAGNNATGTNASGNNATAGNNLAGNTKNPAIINETTLSAGSKLSYSFVTAFALAAFHLLL